MPFPRSPLVWLPLIRYYSSNSDDSDDSTPGAYLRYSPANDLLSEETESRQDPGEASSGAEFKSDTEASSGSINDLDGSADGSGDDLDSADGSADGSADDFGSEASSGVSGGDGGGY